ncbi:CBS domain-containing protein [Natronoflexus pectinivorans]|uniref:CBS domain-containing protein n=1 Tax=Natronoflexus pectinivorans TaxID=682526 RepID=A0A4R2GMB2_9BACT|nr:CBS domain-containing protein [Natronoflexus pectinivorans]TCO10402.1 CBS domain-containing protein [Natronoflexus pectinivorans]
MLAKDLISDIIPALKTSDTGLDALNWMEAFKVSHLPIVNNKVFLGLVSDTDIYELNTAGEPLGNHRLSLMKPYIFAHQHIYDVIEIASRLKLSIVPVLTIEQEYTGVITQYDLMQQFSELIAAHTPGGIIQIEIAPRDYALSELARIVEDSDSKILSLYVTQEPLSGQLFITIKLNRTDLQPVINGFERYGYKIRAEYGSESHMDETAKRNYESLIRYLSV